MRARVFIYGSLLRGLHNHHFLQADTTLLRAPASTKLAAYRLLDSGNGFPYATSAAAGYAIRGELYEVSAKVLERLDELEGHPDIYCRQKVVVENESEPAWMYLVDGKPDWMPTSLCEALPQGDWREHINSLAQRGQGELVPAGTWLDTQCTAADGDGTSRHAVFCFGSNGIDQLRERCQNERLVAVKACLPNAVRVFAGWSSRWHGGVASVVPMSGQTVQGSIVYLNAQELSLLDGFEGVGSSEAPYAADGSVYCRHDVIVCAAPHVAPPSSLPAVPPTAAANAAADDATAALRCVMRLRAVLYRQVDLTWRGNPSERYLEACERNLRPFWRPASVEVRDASGWLRSPTIEHSNNTVRL